MRKKLFHIIKSLLLAGLILNFVAACGGSSSSTVQTVSGTASGGAALTGNITLKDAKGAVKTVAIGNGGAYSIPVDGLSAPFLISAGSYFSLATAPGVTNVNPFTTLAIAGAAGTNDIGAIFNASTMDSAKLNSIANGLNTAVTNINTQLASVYGKYNLSTSQQDFMNSSIAIDRGIDSLFSLLKVQVASTGITVALASSPSTTLFSSDTKGSVTVPNTIYWGIHFAGVSTTSCDFRTSTLRT